MQVTHTTDVQVSGTCCDDLGPGGGVGGYRKSSISYYFVKYFCMCSIYLSSFDTGGCASLIKQVEKFFHFLKESV